MSDFPKFQGPNAPERLRRAVMASNIGTSYADIERELGVSEEELLAYWALPWDPVFQAEARAKFEERMQVLRSDDMRRETAALLLSVDSEGIVRVSRPEDDDVIADWVVSFEDAAASTTFDDLIDGTIELVRNWPGVERVEHVDREMVEVSGVGIDGDALESTLRAWWHKRLSDILSG